VCACVCACAALRRRAQELHAKPAREQEEIWTRHIWPSAGAGEGGALCPSLPLDVASFTLHCARAQLAGIERGGDREGERARPAASSASASSPYYNGAGKRERGRGRKKGQEDGCGEGRERVDSAGPALTVLEVYVHTAKLREQVRVLAHLCRCPVAPHEIPLIEGQEAAAEEEDAACAARDEADLPPPGATAGADTSSREAGAARAGIAGGWVSAGEGEWAGGNRRTLEEPLSVADSRQMLYDLYTRVDRADAGGAAVWRTLLRQSMQPYLDALAKAIFLAQVED